MNLQPYSGAALRLAAWQFLTGKAISGLLSFVILLWLVRLLPVPEYAAYLSLIAAAELVFSVSSFGLPWAVARFLPDARLHAQPAVTKRFVWRIVQWQAGILTLFCVGAILGHATLLPTLGLAVSGAAVSAWIGFILTQGLGRFLRDAVLGALLQQGIARLSLIVRLGLFLGLLGLLVLFERVSLDTVLAAEALASLVAVLAALGGIAWHLRALPELQYAEPWDSPSAHALWRIALPMYAGSVFTLAYSPQVFLLLLQRFAGAEAAAVFGFLRSLYQQASRYLPATLLFGLVRPKLVASYVGGGGLMELSRSANLAGKLSLFVLMPVVAFTFAAGEPLVAVLSGGKFDQTGLLLFGFMLALVPASQRQLLETVAVTVGRTQLCILGAVVGLATLPLMLGLLYGGAGAWAGVAGLGSGELLFVLVVGTGLARVGYQPDHGALLRLCGAAVAAAAGALLVRLLPSPPGGLILQALAACAAFMAAVGVLKPFPATERQRLGRLLSRKVRHA